MRRNGAIVIALGVAACAWLAVAVVSGAPRRVRPAKTPLRAPLSGPSLESSPVQVRGTETWIGANDLARLLDATKFWSAETRKLVLRTPGHRIQLTVDNPFVIVDNRTVGLKTSVRSLEGELQVPVALVDSLPHDSTLARLVFDPGRSAVFRVPPAGVVGPPQVSVEGAATRVTFPIDRPDEVVVASRSRAHFRLRFSGFFAGLLSPSFPEGSLVRAIRPIASVSGSAFEFEIAREAAGFRIVGDPLTRRLVLTLQREAAADLESFAPEGTPGPRPLRVVVIDPGHGGRDAGVQVAGVVEKNLTLALAKLLKAEIENRTAARVVLTRDDDRALNEDERAQRANRARADIVVSLHFDGFPGPLARGATGYCPPATFGSTPQSAWEPGAPPPILPWRDVVTRHAVRSRELADAVLSALELHDLGPTRLREVLPYSLLGVNAPGLMIECATLTSDADRARVTSGHGLADLAVTLADGIVAYQRSE